MVCGLSITYYHIYVSQGDVQTVEEMLSKGERAFRAASKDVDVRIAGSYAWISWDKQASTWTSAFDFVTRSLS